VADFKVSSQYLAAGGSEEETEELRRLVGWCMGRWGISVGIARGYGLKGRY
jgi:hypothetical protein